MFDNELDRPTRKLKAIRPRHDVSWQELLGGPAPTNLEFDGTGWTDDGVDQARSIWSRWLGRPTINVSIDVSEMDGKCLRMCSSFVAEFVRARASL